jgi:uncharacterized protein
MLSDYKPPLLYKNAHLAAILPNQLRKTSLPKSNRISITTADDDFLDLDIYSQNHKRAVILVHGLEGSSQSTYIKGMAQQMLESNLDAICLNMRGCSGRPNKQFCAYHSGKTEDLETVVQHFSSRYAQLVLIGFSLGGNLVLKYTGERGSSISKKVSATIGISVPLDLAGSCDTLSLSHNKLYLTRFLHQLSKKAKQKAIDFPDSGLQPEQFEHLKDFRAFDNLYTAPAHGFADANEYYAKCSAKQFLKNIHIPTLIINAKNDTFLSESCYPKPAELSESITYLAPNYGGHVGFASNIWMNRPFWSEQCSAKFLTKTLGS